MAPQKAPNNDLNSREKRQIFGAFESRRDRLGQAAIEYILIVGICTLIFGAMFYAVRQGLFRLWICDITPRIESPGGCDFNSRQCYAEPTQAADAKDICQSLAP